MDQFFEIKMTLVTFSGMGRLGVSAALVFSSCRGSPQKLRRLEMGGGFGQQTGWIQVGDLAFAFVFPVRLAQTEEPESEQVAA
jgi:hypothetical protein